MGDPLAAPALGLKITPGLRLKMDWGVLTSGPEGTEVLRREYWANKATSTLADAPTDEIKAAWKPLGYNIRPVRLQMIAREVQAEYGGTIPATPAELQKLKGIGKYTAGAVACFGYHQPAALVDTNVDRVLQRVFYGKPSSENAQDEKTAWSLAETLVPQDNPYDYNQALMDFGATVCMARKPLCLLCPMQALCLAYPVPA
jgi:A/G-specific adenine glycosylase